LSDHEVRDELPLCQGFALIAWSIENNGVCEVERLGPGYIGLEIERRLKNG
jgi:hypothetical protein